MSSTDPQRPGDDPRRPDDPSQAPAGTGATTPDTGRHAVQRPTPAPPEPEDGPVQAPPDPVLSPTVARPTAAEDAPGSPAPDAPHEAPAHRADGDTDADDAPATAGRPVRDDATPDRSPRAADDADTDRDELFPDANAPRTPHAGTHVLGVLVGLVLAPFAVVLLLLGQSRILEVQVDGWDASLELLGIVLVSSGGLVLAVLLALGLWSAAVPLTGGLLVTALGGLQLYAPGVARSLALDVLGGGTWDRPVALANVAGTSGTTFTAGLLLLTAGVVLTLARRHGVRLGAFRERNRPA